MKVSDSQLAARLAAILDGVGIAHISPKNASSAAYDIELRLQVHDNHRGDSPDIILKLMITLKHPVLPALSLEIPIPIEGEKAGIGAALEDLQKFVDRGHFPQKLPMLVVGGSGNPARRNQSVKVPAKFEIVQVPYRLIAE